MKEQNNDAAWAFVGRYIVGIGGSLLCIYLGGSTATYFANLNEKIYSLELVTTMQSNEINALKHKECK